MKSSQLKKLGGHFVFREVTSQAELAEHLRLRYRVLEESSIKRLLKRNALELDMDAYDLRSRHFILIHHRPDGSKKVVGGQRGVYLPGCHHSIFASDLFQRHSVTIGAESTVREVLPCFEYLPDDSILGVRDYVQNAMKRGESLAESSRFHLDPEYASLRLAVFLVRSVIAAYILGLGTHHGIMIVSAHHKRFYLGCGFQQIDDTHDGDYRVMGLDASTLQIAADHIPEPAMPVLKEMSATFKACGQICFDPSSPSCFEQPYATIDKPVAAVA